MQRNATYSEVSDEGGLRQIRFPDLRHTFASLLIQKGDSLAYVNQGTARAFQHQDDGGCLRAPGPRRQPAGSEQAADGRICRQGCGGSCRRAELKKFAINLHPRCFDGERFFELLW